MRFSNVLSLLERSAGKYPDKAAFGDVDGDLTFSELERGAKTVGSFLAERIPENAPVAFYLDKSNIAVTAMLGTIYARGFYSVIDVRSPLPRVEKILNVLEPAVILTDRKSASEAEKIKTGTEFFVIEDILENNRPDEALLKKVRAEALDIDPIYVNFTSGSTGVPKGVTVAHRSVIDFIDCFTELFDINETDILGNQAPFDFDVSVKDIYSALYTGAKVQIIPREYFSVPMQLMDYLADHKVTTLVWAVSAMCFVSIMNGFDYRVPETVRRVMFSGEVMPVKQLKVWKRFLPDATYVNLYGPTEITCNCTYYILDRDFEDGEVIPAGIPFPNEKVFLLSGEDKLIKEPGEVGEIVVSGTAVAEGYYNDKERTEAVFVQNPLQNRFLEPVYRTGDLGKFDAEGNLIYVSRKDFQIKHMGQRIELGEIEAVASSAPEVERVCCVYDEAKHRILMFYLGKADKKALSAFLREKLPPYMVPNSIKELVSMPLNKNGKIDRRALLEGKYDPA
ncbi:MAG: amino acid adenylation domain-containing protein [Lachnospiraceae bacterium]|nr:amino acid adenylation domain-containing protein [Lachnospiraceae bacterium]